MSSDKYEIAYYPEICEKLGKQLDDIFEGLHKFDDSQNKQLDLMIAEIHDKLGLPRGDVFYPPLKIDIAFGIEFPGGVVSPLLLEVKRGTNLTLMDYSQLVGYLQVARHIKVGILMLVNLGNEASQLSTDFKHLIDIQQLTFDWAVTSSTTGEINRFRTGICVYTPGNGIDWINSSNNNGISSWEELCECLKPA